MYFTQLFFILNIYNNHTNRVLNMTKIPNIQQKPADHLPYTSSNYSTNVDQISCTEKSS